MLDWLIIGGGPQGVHIGVRLSGRGGASRNAVGVLDPHGDPMHEWRIVTAGLGMAYLRSPVVHHLGRRSLELVEFAERRRHTLTMPPFRGRYRRPSLELFDAHALHCAREAGLTEMWHRGSAATLVRARRGWRVETEQGSLEARRVVLAAGSSRRLARPAWARGLEACVSHALDPERPAVPPGRVLVVGGGLSAAQAAMKLADDGHPVTLLSRHLPRVHRFDSEPGWLGPKLMRAFKAEGDPRRRREMIAAARHRGSMPSDVHHALRAAEAAGRVQRRTGSVTHGRGESGGIRLSIAEAGTEQGDAFDPLWVRHVVLATGYAADASSPPWITDLAERLGLPLAPCGAPLTDTALQWAPGLHVTGPLAELELGPVARNLAGARRAGEILAAVARLTGVGTSVRGSGRDGVQRERRTA